MSTRTMEVSVLVKLVDRLTAPLRGLQRGFERLGAVMRRLGTMGAILAGISFAVPLQQAAALDQQLRDIVVTTGLVGAQAEKQIAAMRASFHAIALATGIYQTEIAKAAAYLSSAGMDDAIAQQLLEPMMRVAKASTSVPEDVAKVAFALSDQLKISSADMEMAMAKLIKAGRLGRFEFKAMAKELPALATQFSGFGITGMKAVEALGASLQVAMFGAPDQAAAANNFKNFLSKVLSPDAIKNFKEQGVDIVRVMEDAAVKGINPVEAAIGKVAKIAGMSAQEIDKIFRASRAKGATDAQAIEKVKEQLAKIGGREKLAQVFGDMQVLDFLLPMLQNLERYKQFLAEIKSAGLEEITNGFKVQWAGLQTQLDLFGITAYAVTDRIGLAFAKNLPWINDGLQQMLKWVSEVDAAYPGLIDKVLSWAGAALVVVAALAILGPVVSALGAAFGVLAALVTALLTPIGIVVAVLAGAAVIIWRNWDQFAGHFAAMWQGLRAIATGVVQYLVSLFAGDWTGIRQGLALIWAGIKAFASGVGSVLATLASIIAAWIKDTFGVDVVATVTAWADAIVETIDAGWGRVKAGFDALKTWVKEKIDAAVEVARGAWGGLFDAANVVFEKIKGAWASLVSWMSNLVPTISWPSMPSWLGGGAAPAAGQDGGKGAPGAPAVAPAAPEKQASAGQFAPARQVASRSEVGGRIVVSAVGGAKVERVQSDNPTVPLTTDRGAVVGRA